MDIIKASTDWVKSELFSTPFFILFGIGFLAVSIGFWQLGKTEMARAYVIPTLIAGILLITIGVGLFYTNKTRFVDFPIAYEKNASDFIQSELERTEATLKEYNTVVFKAIPIIMIACSLIIVFVNKPNWRASAITAIAMLIVILFIDGTASARVENYKQELMSIEKVN